MTLSRGYKRLHSVFILHGAISIVSLTTFILRVDFKEVAPANCDFSGSFSFFSGFFSQLTQS